MYGRRVAEGKLLGIDDQVDLMLVDLFLPLPLQIHGIHLILHREPGTGILSLKKPPGSCFCPASPTPFLLAM